MDNILLDNQNNCMFVVRFGARPSILEAMSEKGIRWKSWADTAAVSSYYVFDTAKSHCLKEWEGIKRRNKPEDLPFLLFISFRVIKAEGHTTFIIQRKVLTVYLFP